MHYVIKSNLTMAKSPKKFYKAYTFNKNLKIEHFLELISWKCIN